MTSTRMSFDIATTILRTVSACALSPYFSLSSLVTPSTSIAISSPKSSRTMSSVYSVSSTVSCSSAAAIVLDPMPRSARICATATGWLMYGSPLLRSWPECAFSAAAYARSMRATSPFGWWVRTVLMRRSTAPAGCAREKMRGRSVRREVLLVVVSLTFAPPGHQV